MDDRDTVNSQVAHLHLLAPLLAIAWAASAAPQTAPLADVLRRAASYAEAYHREFTSVVAEEEYVQRVTRPSGGGALAAVTGDSEQRTLRSDYLLLRGQPGETAWLSFRDIFEVDGRAVAGERGRLEHWLRDSRASFASRARALALDQARYNVGDLVRTINVPLLPLEFLLRDNQERLRFRLNAQATALATPVFVVSFDERRRPTLIRTPEGGDVPTNGLFWIEPASGQVLKTELRTGERNRQQVRTTITVVYERNERLNMVVPLTMEETYATGTELITGTARYSNYRRFETDARIKSP